MEQEPADTDLQWLRHKAISRDERGLNLLEPEPSRGVWKYAALGIVVLLCGAFLYVQWNLRSFPVHHPGSASGNAGPGSTPVPPKNLSAASPAPVESSAPETPATTPATAPPSQSPVASASGNPQVSASPTATPPSESAASFAKIDPIQPPPPVPVQTAARIEKLSGTAAESVPAPGIDDGHQELQFAQHYLEGSPRDSTEAAKWLWKSVSKQNATALVLLSNLYQAGDGVPKSCEQARLLLVAAAKKGNTEAAGKLRTFDSSTCH
jgi:hypothetical protein